MSALQRDESVASNASQTAQNSSELHGLLDVLPVGVFIQDAAQRIRWINPAATELLGLEREAALGQPCREVMRCSFCGEHCAAWEARATGTIRRAFPTVLRDSDGQKRSVLIDAVPLRADHVAVVMCDVTEAAQLERSLEERWVCHGLICVATAMKEVVDRIRDVAPFDSTVLILGESGTGKELVARAIHAESLRSGRPFVAVNCSAYSENLLESELFGHVKGSFTGAVRDRQGRFEMADGGTVFLDEIGELTPKMQVKLLRVLQEREIERVGDAVPRSVDVRIVAATNRDLRQAVRDGQFREDLYYRLNVYTLELPPLRERKEDVAALAHHFLELYAGRMGKTLNGFSPEVMTTFEAHCWPGNVRELENVVESSVVRARGAVVTSADLPASFRAEALPPARPEERIRAALHRAAGCVTRAAKLLGVHRTTLWRQMRELGLRRRDFLP